MKRRRYHVLELRTDGKVQGKRSAGRRETEELMDEDIRRWY